MAATNRAPGRLALMTLFFVASGCAQLQWSGDGPGSPGQLNTVLPDTMASGRSSAERSSLPTFEPAPPFSASDRVRIAPIQPLVEQIANKHKIDPDLVNGIIWVESRFQTRAKSPAGARGLMQLMPPTADAMAREMGRSIARPNDPEFNVEAGSLYLFKLLDRYDGDETLALAAYNAGSGNVSRWMREDGELPPRSLHYVENVQRARLRFVAMRDDRSIDDGDRTMLAAAPAPVDESRSPRVPTPPRPRASERPREEPEPRPNPLAPSPDVYRPEPTPEPPLVDTPYPPIVEEPSAQTTTRTKGDPPRELPSVLD